MFTGVKTNYYTMGFDNTIELANPDSEKTATKVDSILKWAQDAGKDTGKVILIHLTFFICKLKVQTVKYCCHTQCY
jgi:alkaline phosphatase